MPLTSAGSSFSSSTNRANSKVLNNYTGSNPGFVDPARWDFRLKSKVSLVNGGVYHGIFDAYAQIYGVSYRNDIYGAQRVFSGAIDIGAAEYQR